MINYYNFRTDLFVNKKHMLQKRCLSSWEKSKSEEACYVLDTYIGGMLQIIFKSQMLFVSFSLGRLKSKKLDYCKVFFFFFYLLYPRNMSEIAIQWFFLLFFFSQDIILCVLFLIIIIWKIKCVASFVVNLIIYLGLVWILFSMCNYKKWKKNHKIN